LWDYLYQIERITKTAAGDVSMDLVHFPINGSGVSPIALAVAETFGTGIMLTSNRTGVSCDASPSRASDTSVPAETYQSGTYVAPVSYIYGGGIWEEWSQVPPDIDEEVPPNVILNEPKDPPPEEPPEQKPEPAPEPTPEPTSGFTGAFAPANWTVNRVIVNPDYPMSFNWGEEYPSIGSLGGYVEFTATTATLYAPVVYSPSLPNLFWRRFIISITPAYACTVSFTWTFYPQSYPHYLDDLPTIHYPFDNATYTSPTDTPYSAGDPPNGFNLAITGAQSGTQTITADGTNTLAFDVDSIYDSIDSINETRGRLVISNFVVTPL
jgi:hypothetical protein